MARNSTAIRAEQYIVVGRHESQRNSWIPDGDIRGVCSGHRTERAAWIAARAAHAALGGCDGSNSLTDVLRRYAPMKSRKAQAILEDQRSEYPEYLDWYEHAGWLYVGCDYWQGHQIVVAPGGLAAIPRGSK